MRYRGKHYYILRIFYSSLYLIIVIIERYLQLVYTVPLNNSTNYGSRILSARKYIYKKKIRIINTCIYDTQLRLSQASHVGRASVLSASADEGEWESISREPL